MPGHARPAVRPKGRPRLEWPFLAVSGGGRYGWEMRGPTKRTKYIVVSIAVGLLLGLVLAELSMRVVQYGPDSLLPSVMSSIHPIGTSGMLRASTSLDIGYELRPNLDRLYKKVAFRTNSAGLRDREYAVEKPPNTFRVAVIGDSFTMPAGVVIEDAFHSRVETSLNSAAGEGPDSTRYEFLNFGVGGYQLPQYLATLRERALEYDPDLILIGMSTNDHFYVRMPGRPKKRPYQVKPQSDPFFESALLTWFRRQANASAPARRRKLGMTPASREHVEEYFGKIGRVARDSGVPVAAVFLAQYNWPFTDLVRELGTIAEANGISFIDASEPFVERNPALRIYPADGHPNGVANAVFAEVLERELLARSLVPPPRSQTKPGSAPLGTNPGSSSD